jgi:hypothetical protein
VILLPSIVTTTFNLPFLSSLSPTISHTFLLSFVCYSILRVPIVTRSFYYFPSFPLHPAFHFRPVSSTFLWTFPTPSSVASPTFHCLIYLLPPPFLCPLPPCHRSFPPISSPPFVYTISSQFVCLFPPSSSFTSPLFSCIPFPFFYYTFVLPPYLLSLLSF